MNNYEAYKLYKEEAKRHAFLKRTCDSCIPDELIELDKIVLRLIMNESWEEEMKSISDDLYKKEMNLYDDRTRD